MRKFFLCVKYNISTLWRNLSSCLYSQWQSKWYNFMRICVFLSCATCCISIDRSWFHRRSKKNSKITSSLNEKKKDPVERRYRIKKKRNSESSVLSAAGHFNAFSKSIGIEKKGDRPQVLIDDSNFVAMHCERDHWSCHRPQVVIQGQKITSMKSLYAIDLITLRLSSVTSK